MTGVSDWVQQLPWTAAPDDVAAEMADLRFAGRYIPAGAGREPIAGDFYDLLGLDSDLVALIVGDVAGHGVTASARMQQLRAAARAYALEDPSPASVISRLDRFCARLDPEAIATLWYGQYRPSTGVLSYASGGHPPPVLTCHGEPSRLLENAASPPLGVGSGQLVAEHCEHLPAGAVLVAYSDGLVERRGTDIDAQIELLRDIVTGACDPARDAGADEIASEIVSSLVPVPGCAEDDVCLLVVRRKAG